MGGPRIFELGGQRGSKAEAWGQKKTVVIGLLTEENFQQVLWPLTNRK